MEFFIHPYSCAAKKNMKF